MPIARARRASTVSGWTVLGCFLTVFVGAGCASAAAAVRTSRATAAVERAAESGAGEEFPYEMTLAQAYLAKAREESSEAQYQDALRFARLSQENAERAVDLQRERRNANDTEALKQAAAAKSAAKSAGSSAPAADAAKPGSQPGAVK